MAVRIVDKIINYLKENQGTKLSPKEVALAIDANPNTVRGRMSDLNLGKVKVGKSVVKVTKLKTVDTRKTVYRFPESQSERISSYKLYRVSYKIAETKKKRWKKTNMNLEGYVDGIVKRTIDDKTVQEVVGEKLATECLRVYFRNLGAGSDNVPSAYLGIQTINENPLDMDYGLGKWIGEIELVGESGHITTEKTNFTVKESEYDE